jgi:subtilase family serine protease
MRTGCAAIAGLVMAGCLAGQALAAPHKNGAHSFQPPFKAKVLGYRPNGKRKLSSGGPTGLPPSAIASVYNLSGLSPSSGAGSGQIIAIVDAYHDPNALSDLNKWNAQYGYPALSTCSSLTQTGACFEQVEGTSDVQSNWALEESLDIEWAHAEAPQAKVVLVEAASNANSDMFNAVQEAGSIGATEVSMSWVVPEYSGETSDDGSMTHSGTLYTASSGDAGNGAMFPAASPNVIAVGGTTLVGCSGTTCRHFRSETAWPGSGGGISSFETIPSFQSQSSYSGPVFGASSITTLTGGRRGIPDVSFDANPGTGVAVYDSTPYQGQAGWFTLGGTSVGAPNWAGILAAGRSASLTALEGDQMIFTSGYKTNLRDITSGTNGPCGTACTAGPGYDLITGLGSPLSYP